MPDRDQRWTEKIGARVEAGRLEDWNTNEEPQVIRSGDAVHHPAHYTSGNVECIDAIKASMTPEAYKGYLKGNCLKYLWRYEQKGGREDLKKAKVYLGWLEEAE